MTRRQTKPTMHVRLRLDALRGMDKYLAWAGTVLFREKFNRKAAEHWRSLFLAVLTVKPGEVLPVSKALSDYFYTIREGPFEDVGSPSIRYLVTTRTGLQFWLPEALCEPVGAPSDPDTSPARTDDVKTREARGTAVP